MKKFLLIICLSIPFLSLNAQKFKESENVATIKQNVYVLTNENGDFWTEVGTDKGREYLLESVFLEEGDNVAFFMEDQKTAFEGTFSSEEGLILDAIPQKTKEGIYRYRGSHEVKQSGEFFWKFLVMDKEAFLINPKLILVLSKKDNAIYRAASTVKSQLEYLIAMASSQFVPIMGDFIEKDIKEARYQSTYSFQGKDGEVVISKKGFHYKSVLYYGEDATAAKQARIQIEDNVLEALEMNCGSKPKIVTQPPYSLFKEYYAAEFKGCGDEKVEVVLYHYLKRGKYTVELEVLYNN
jgi:hypothetical protein